MSKAIATEKRIKDLEITRAYAEYKVRHAGDLDADLANWVNDIILSIAIKKVKSRSCRSATKSGELLPGFKPNTGKY